MTTPPITAVFVFIIGEAYNDDDEDIRKVSCKNVLHEGHIHAVGVLAL